MFVDLNDIPILCHALLFEGRGILFRKLIKFNLGFIYMRTYNQLRQTKT